MRKENFEDSTSNQIISAQSLQNFDRNIINLPTVLIKILGIDVIAMLDSGASVSLLQSDVFHRIQNDKSIKFHKLDINVQSVTGDKLNISRCVSLIVNLGNKTIRHRFYIVENSLSAQYQAILGYEFLKQHKFTLCFRNNMLTSGNTRIPVHDALAPHIKENSINYARLKTKFILEPNESRKINLKLDSSVQQGSKVQVTPCLKNSAIVIGSNLCSVDDNQSISVTIKNVGTKEVPLNKNTRIGLIHHTFDTRNLEYIKMLRRKELKASDFQLSHLDPSLKSQLLDLIMEFADIFSKRLFTIGRTNAITPNLLVDYSKLPSNRPYRIPHALLSELKQQLKELEDANIIEKSNSHVSCPLLMIKKKNTSNDPNSQKWRLVVDFRALNSQLKYPRYRLPLTNHLLENLSGSKYFTSLDLHSSFWQIPLKLEDRDMTTFSTPYGNFRYITMPQGLSASPETFSQLADQILNPISDLNISNFVDDFCVSGNDAPQMLFKLRKLFERFREFGLTLNPEKCSFFLPEIQFLGHIVNAQGIRPLNEHIRKITDFPIPNTVRKVRRFIGCASYYRRFIKDFSKISTPLTNLVRKNQKFKWNPEAQASFDLLKEKLSQPPILIHPDFDKEFILSCDASDSALGAMLGQRDESNIIHPIAYFSQKLNPTQIRYAIFEKELLSIVQSIKSFKYYLYGRKFTIRCDNAALTKLTKLETVSSRVARWFIFLSEYNYVFEHISSSENNIADIMSRDFFSNTSINSQTENTAENNVNMKMISRQNKKSNEVNDLEKKKLASVKTIPLMRQRQFMPKINHSSIGAGLQNLGNNCYMNVILQVFAHCEPIVKYLSSINTSFCVDSDSCMLCILKNHIDLVHKCTGQIIKPLKMYNYVHKISSHFEPGRQEDAHEFLYFLINELREVSPYHCSNENRTVIPSNANIVQQVLEGCCQTLISCTSCSRSSFSFDPIMDFNLELVQGATTLEEILNNFMQPEAVCDGYRCLNCKINTSAIKQCMISQPPLVAMFQLKRFHMNKSGIHKINRYISYPEILDFRPYMSNAEGKPSSFNLNAVIVHAGHTFTNGHYFCYVKDSLGNWFRMDDNSVQQVSLKEVLSQQAYILFYTPSDTGHFRVVNTFSDKVPTFFQSHQFSSLPSTFYTSKLIKQNPVNFTLLKESPNKNTYTCNDNNSIPVDNFGVNFIQIDLPTIEDIKSAQRSDIKLAKIISTLENSTDQSSDIYPNYFLKDNLLMHSSFIPTLRKTTNVLQIVIPDKYKPQILASKHIAHYKILKIYNTIRERYFWENLHSDTKKYVPSCPMYCI